MVAKIGIVIGVIVQTKSNFYKLKKAYALVTYISTTIQIKTKIPFFVKLKKIKTFGEDLLLQGDIIATSQYKLRSRTGKV